MTKSFTQSTFSDEVLASDKPVLVDFWASWCGPCKMIAPVVDKLAADLSASHLVGKVDIDSNPGLAQEYAIQSIPTLILFKDGRAVGRTMGFQSETQLRNFVISHS
ncbi:MAG: thioredoxin [Planctomycetes bacterium]|nr:thioredoxin [Planctomycetota bacterium]